MLFNHSKNKVTWKAFQVTLFSARKRSGTQRQCNRSAVQRSDSVLFSARKRMLWWWVIYFGS